MTAALETLATGLLLSFITCCVVSGILQILAWTRHTREGAPVTFRAMLDPEPYFDDVGLRQIHLSRRLVTVGAAAYVGYVLMMLVG